MPRWCHDWTTARILLLSNRFRAACRTAARNSHRTLAPPSQGSFPCQDRASRRFLGAPGSGLAHRAFADEQVCSMWAASVNPKLRQIFVGDLQARANQFSDILALTDPRWPIVYRRIDAYGRLRWVKLRAHDEQLKPDEFIAWVPPGLEEAVSQMKSADADPMPTSGIESRLPDPVIEDRCAARDSWRRTPIRRRSRRISVPRAGLGRSSRPASRAVISTRWPVRSWRRRRRRSSARSGAHPCPKDRS